MIVFANLPYSLLQASFLAVVDLGRIKFIKMNKKLQRKCMCKYRNWGN